MIKTRFYTIEDLQVNQVKEDIKTTLTNGLNVVFPTETVYGIGANALSEQGVKNIYKVKGRPSDNPLIMHIADPRDRFPYIKDEQDYVQELIDAFWPGPLTLVFTKTDLVPDFITGGLDSVGIRMPSSKIAQEIINIAQVPICAPSANISGRPSSTEFKHVVEDFNNLVDIIIDGGKSNIGIESTVLDVTKEIPVILRPGMVTAKMIKDITKNVIISTSIEQDETPKSPGMKYKHYAPKGKLTIVKGDTQKVVNFINKQAKEHLKQGISVGVITVDEYKDKFSDLVCIPIGKDKNDIEIASNLFTALREMDQQNIEIIYSFSFDDLEYSEAIMNRLSKAANNQIINL